MIVRSEQHRPAMGQKISAIVVWMDEEPMDREKLYYLKQGTLTVRATVRAIPYLLDINTGNKLECNTLSLNQIAAVEILCSSPLVCDSYSDNKGTGAFIIIDPLTNFTSAAGIITGAEAESTTDGNSVINISLSRHGIAIQNMELLNSFCKIVESRTGVTINCTE